MKRIILSMFALVLLAGAAQAQDKGRGKGKDHHEMPFHHLNLTDAQKTQLKAIHDKQKEEMQALQKNDQITVKQWKEKRKELHEKYKTQFQSVLTTEQKEQLAKGHGERKHHGMRPGVKGHRMAGPNKAKEIGQQLDLTDAQKEKMKALRADFKSRAETIRKDNSLTREQKKTKFQELVKQEQEQRKSILTKEQLEKIETFKKERTNRATK